MSYSKKDEDGDQAIFKVDRTTVFQEGTQHPEGQLHKFKASVMLLLHRVLLKKLRLLTLGEMHSSPVQYIANITSKMSDTPDQNHLSPTHGREIPNVRSYLPFLWHYQAVPTSRCIVTANGLSCHQGAGKYGRGCHHGHELDHEGHSCRQWCCIQSERYQGIMQDYWCKLKPTASHILSNGNANPDHFIGNKRSSYRKTNQNRHCRQNPFRFFRRIGFLVPPPTISKRRCSKMGERNAGSCRFKQIRDRHLRSRIFATGWSSNGFHDTISRNWFIVSDAISRQNVLSQAGSAVWCAKPRSD